MTIDWERELKGFATKTFETAVKGAAGALAKEGRRIVKKVDKTLKKVERRAESPPIEVEAEEVDDRDDDPRYP